jgi:hypothetical protein
MSRTQNSKRKALTALALSLVAAGALTATASGQQSPEIPYLSHGQGVDETQFQGSDNGGPMFPNGVPYGYVGRGVDSGAESAPALGATDAPLQSSAAGGPMFPNGVPYGYVGRGVDSGAESAPALGAADAPLQSSADGGPVFMNGVPDGYVGSGVESATGGVTPTDLARAVPRYGPYGPLPQTHLVPEAPPAVAVSASSDGFDRDDVGIGFGLGLILAMAGAIALAATRNRTRMAHS